MDERHCSAAEAIRAVYELMCSILSGMKDYLNTRGVSIIEVATRRMRMEDWLVCHILTIDIQLRDC